jgi:hypothetical protein
MGPCLQIPLILLLSQKLLVMKLYLQIQMDSYKQCLRLQTFISDKDQGKNVIMCHTLLLKLQFDCLLHQEDDESDALTRFFSFTCLTSALFGHTEWQGTSISWKSTKSHNCRMSHNCCCCCSYSPSSSNSSPEDQNLLNWSCHLLLRLAACLLFWYYITT